MSQGTVIVHIVCCLTNQYTFPIAKGYDRSHFQKYWTAQELHDAFFHTIEGGLLEALVSLPKVEGALNKLAEDGLLIAKDFPNADRRYKIVRSNLREYISDRPTDSILNLAIEIGAEPVVEALKRIETGTEQDSLSNLKSTYGSEDNGNRFHPVPASDRIVDLDDNREPTDAAARAVGDVINQIGEIHDNEHTEERSAVLTQLRQAVQPLADQFVFFLPTFENLLAALERANNFLEKLNQATTLVRTALELITRLRDMF